MKRLRTRDGEFGDERDKVAFQVLGHSSGQRVKMQLGKPDRELRVVCDAINAEEAKSKVGVLEQLDAPLEDVGLVGDQTGIFADLGEDVFHAFAIRYLQCERAVIEKSASVTDC